MLSRLDDARRRGMPEIAGFGKHFYFYKAWDKKGLPPESNGRSHGRSEKAAETRRFFPTGQPLARARLGLSRREDNPVRTGAVVRFARAPCSFGGGLVGRVRLRPQNLARRSFCGRRANGK